MLPRCVRLRTFTLARNLLCLLSALVLASSGFAADVVVVCADDFRETLEPWCDLREDEGLTLAYCRPSRTAEETATRIRETADAATRYVVLVGDAPAFAPRVQRDAASNRPTQRDAEQTLTIPTFYLESKVTGRFGSTPTYPSDLPYGDFDADGKSDAAVGRLPVVTPEQLASLIERIFVYESSQDFGPWRRSFQLTAGVGGFGMLVDGAIESVTRTVLTSVLPVDAKPQIAYASPGHAFCPVEMSFSDAVLDRYRNGSRFWVYAGHGSIDQLNFLTRSHTDSAALAQPARMTQDGQWQVESLLDNQTVDRLVTRPGQTPIAIMLACYAGAYDAPGDCLSERMLLASGGPIAVIAASRLTMPYGNSRFGLGLLESAFKNIDDADAPARLGDAMRAAANRLQSEQTGSATQLMVDGLASFISPAGINLADERSEHAALYQLLGDPTLNLQAPQPLTLEVNSSLENAPTSTAVAVSGRTVCVSVTSPIAGTLTVCVDRPLTTISGSKERNKATDDPHGCTLAQATIAVESHVAGTTTIPLPDDWHGPVVIRGFVQGLDGWASGAARTVVE